MQHNVKTLQESIVEAAQENISDWRKNESHFSFHKPTVPSIQKRIKESGLYNKHYRDDHYQGILSTLGQELEWSQAAEYAKFSRGDVLRLRQIRHDGEYVAKWSESMMRIMRSSIPNGIIEFAKPVDMSIVGAVEGLQWTTIPPENFESDTPGVQVIGWTREVGSLDKEVAAKSYFTLSIAYPEASVSRVRQDHDEAESEDGQLKVEASIVEHMATILAAVKIIEDNKQALCD